MAIIAIIAVGVSMPGNELRGLTAPLEQFVYSLVPQLKSLYSFQKIGHAVTFALLTFFACLVRQRLGATWLGLICFLFLLAVLTEGVQLFFIGRSSRLLDVGIDLGGAAVGATLYLILWLLSFPLRKKIK
ncbi:MAG: VanZ family protein [Granulosicoccaceae bacterium]